MSFASTKPLTQSSTGRFHALRWLSKLHSIEMGGSRKGGVRIPAAKLADLLRLLMMLMQNGLSLPKALSALSEDRAARRWFSLLDQLRYEVQQGGLLSTAMARHPRTFTPIQIQQVKIGERTGALQRSLENVCASIERTVATRRKIIKKTSYPLLVSVAGFGLVVFMVTFVVPQFRDVFSASGVSLPLVTRVVSAVSELLLRNGLWLIGALFVAVMSLLVLRVQPKGRLVLDTAVLKIPVFGGWIRDASALQFTDSVMAMIESGFTPVEAVEIAVPCVRNRAVRQAVMQVCLAVRRGERLSTEMGRFPTLFPATLCQLINVGEKSGDFSQAMVGASRHLRYQLERRIDGSISLIEPVLTLGLAALIGTVVMSIYMPMFHMFEVLE